MTGDNNITSKIYNPGNNHLALFFNDMATTGSELIYESRLTQIKRLTEHYRFGA